MNTLVMKFGGAAVATPERFSSIAELIACKRAENRRIAVVVSAMGDMTDALIALAARVNPDPPQRELDMLVSVGERISISLLAMALARKDIEAVSFTGSQAGIITTTTHNEARIEEVRPHRLLPHLDADRVVIVAGFQGVSRNGEITTLGRGGSDTTAVALGVALKASCVEFYKDVPGIFNIDPKTTPEAALLPRLSYSEALSIVNRGAQVLHSRSIELAAANGIPLKVLPFAEGGRPVMGGTVIGLEDREPVEDLVMSYES